MPTTTTKEMSQIVVFYKLQVITSELRVESCDFENISFRVASSFLRVAK